MVIKTDIHEVKHCGYVSSVGYLTFFKVHYNYMAWLKSIIISGIMVDFGKRYFCWEIYTFLKQNYQFVWTVLVGLLNWLLMYGNTSICSCLVITFPAGILFPFMNWLLMRAEMFPPASLVITFPAFVLLSIMNRLMMFAEILILFFS